MKMKSDIFFRVDGYKEIGYGHFMRSFVLAQALRKKNFTVQFITCKDKLIRSRLQENKIDHIEGHSKAGTKKDLAETSEILKKYNKPVLIYDSYNISVDYEKKISSYTDKMIAFDDDAKREFYTDVIINQNYRSEKYKYKLQKKETTLLCGSRYILLRDEFLMQRKKSINKRVKNILLILGGSDFKDQSLRISKLLEDYVSLNNINLNIITNDHYKCLNKLRKLSKCNKYIILHHNVRNMADIMKKMDLAISAAGSTVWELLYMGVPSLLMILADNQYNICRSLIRDDLAINLGWYNKIVDKNLIDQVDKIVHNFNRRKQFFKNGQSLIDGKGEERIIKYIN